MRIENHMEADAELPGEQAPIAAQVDAAQVDAARIADGMDVCDRDGEKVGTVSQVYRPRPGIQGEMFVAVETGFLGFGKTFYVPISHIREMDGDRALLDVGKDQLDQTGWEDQPPAIQLDSYQPE
jgi:hypothetical protein